MAQKKEARVKEHRKRQKNLVSKEKETRRQKNQVSKIAQKHIYVQSQKGWDSFHFIVVKHNTQKSSKKQRDPKHLYQNVLGISTYQLIEHNK